MEQLSKPLSLQKRVAFSLAVIIIVTYLIFISLAMLGIAINARKQYTALSQSYAQYLSGSLRFSVWNLDEPGINSICESFMHTSSMSFVRLTDREGNVLFYKQDSADQSFYSTAKIYYGEKEIGKVELGLNSKMISDKIKSFIFLTLLATAVVSTIIFYACQFVLLRLLKDPLDQLKNLVQDISEGHYEMQKASSTYVEFSSIVDQFRDMSAQIQNREQSLMDSQKQTEEILQRFKEAKIQAESANQAKSIFLLNMSHEIRTPMNIVLGMTSILNETSLNEEQKKYLNTINKSGETLLQVINNILDLSKIEAGSFTLVHEDITITEYIEEIVGTLRKKAHEKNLDLLIEISPELPEKIQADALHLKQIILNLMMNAIKFTDKGYIKLTLIPTPDEMIEFRIQDTGRGIEKGQLHLVFDRFFQADSSLTRRSGGTGLGLSICKELVTLMKGTIWIESQLNEGSTFYFKIPLIKAKFYCNLQFKHEKDHSEDQKSVHWTNAAPLRLLAVDDSEENLTLLRLYLKREPVVITPAMNGVEAVEKVKSEKFDMVLMDIQMPILDGHSATRQIRAWERMENRTAVPIVALSAHALQEEADRAVESGCQFHIPKPVSKPMLFEAINRVIREYVLK